MTGLLYAAKRELNLVSSRGFEPLSTRMKTSCPKPLDELDKKTVVPKETNRTLGLLLTRQSLYRLSYKGCKSISVVSSREHPA